MEYRDLKRLAKECRQQEAGYRLAVLGDCATQHIAEAVQGMLFSRGLATRVYDADYDEIRAQIMDANSELYAFCPNAVLICMCTEKLQEAFAARAPETRASFAEDTVRSIEALWRDLTGKCPGVSILQFNFPAMEDGVFGSFAYKQPSSFPRQLALLNDRLYDACAAQKNAYIVDAAGVQTQVGRAAFRDDKLYYIAKMPFSLAVLPQIAARTADVVAALTGRIKKCVVCDLDNTLWGGVIGDDGLEGIEIGELGTGHAFTDLQRWLKQLKERGVLLAVCSKNNEDTAKEPFEKHPEMVLRLSDFAMFVANWNDKAGNIRHIQQTLNIGMDSFVFLDDNPFERAQVRGQIPEIAVPELPEDPALYLSYLVGLNLFETASYSAEDAERTLQYRQEAERATLESESGDYDAYLVSLGMRAVAAPFDAFHAPRIAQLTQRSNQFNLRTIRYTEAQITALIDDPAHITRYYKLRDTFGEYGLISVVIMDKCENDTLFISEWLMSCRVLKRGMEEFIVNDLLLAAKEAGYRRVVGEYVKTPKNAMVADLYPRMGFRAEDGRFVAYTDTYTPHQTRIEREQV